MTQGNKRVQQRNRRKNNKNVPKQDKLYTTIDGNGTYQPFAYCWYHQGFLTRNQSIRHRCSEKKCKRFQTLEDYLKQIEVSKYC